MTQKVPTDWKRSTLIKLVKKDGKSLPRNWRGIILSSIPGKLLALIIPQRIQSPLDKYMREEQHGFTPRRSCNDLIFTLKVLIDDSREWQNKLYMAFIVFEEAVTHCIVTLYGNY
ncbi:uncharacterized protein LOC136025540 [Artemia franciscana]|uniref:uncharacterized protein LOC136025540 n=1 Tax=Artemia franciscana TaxID=6661 RepID=UPI0032DA948B